MNTRFAVVALLTACVSLCGCSYSFHMESTLPDTAMVDKSPLKVAVYIPQSTLDYTQPTLIKTICAGGGGFAPNNFGVIFAETVRGTMGQVFQETTPINQPLAKGHDLIIQAELKEMIYKFGCMGDPIGYYLFKGTFRAVDAQGTEIWRSKQTESKFQHPGGLLFKDAIPAVTAALVGQWTQELLAAPQIQRLSNRQADRPKDSAAASQ
jgi:hypothetical protein